MIKNFNEINQHLLNFERDHKNDKEETEHSYISRTKICFRCKNTRHVAAV